MEELVPAEFELASPAKPTPATSSDALAASPSSRHPSPTVPPSRRVYRSADLSELPACAFTEAEARRVASASERQASSYARACLPSALATPAEKLRLVSSKLAVGAHDRDRWWTPASTLQARPQGRRRSTVSDASSSCLDPFSKASVTRSARPPALRSEARSSTEPSVPWT